MSTTSTEPVVLVASQGRIVAIKERPADDQARESHGGASSGMPWGGWPTYETTVQDYAGDLTSFVWTQHDESDPLPQISSVVQFRLSRLG